MGFMKAYGRWFTKTLETTLLIPISPKATGLYFPPIRRQCFFALLLNLGRSCDFFDKQKVAEEIFCKLQGLTLRGLIPSIFTLRSSDEPWLPAGEQHEPEVFCFYLFLKILLKYSVAREKAMATHSSTLTWKIPWTEEPGRLTDHGVAESDTTEAIQQQQQCCKQSDRTEHTHAHLIYNVVLISSVW